MSYGPDQVAMCRRAPSFVDKILKGAKPGNLPVEQPTKLELFINLKVARILGLSVPPMLLAVARGLRVNASTWMETNAGKPPDSSRGLSAAPAQGGRANPG